MITKFEKYQLITEDPDYISSKNLSFRESDTIPFFCTVNKDHSKVEKMYIGEYNTCHYEIPFKYEDENNDIIDKYKRDDMNLCQKTYPGRLWMNSKIMSFWVYPNETLFIDIIQNIEKELNIKIFKNHWRIEVIKKGTKIKRKTIGGSDDPNYYFKNKREGTVKVISVDKYIGSEDQSEEKRKKWHLMTPDEKRIAKLKGEAPDFRGWGSDMTAWDGPNPIWWRQAKYQEKFNTNFKSYKLNENPDHLSINLKNLSWNDSNAKPFYITVNSDHTKVNKLYIGNYSDYHAKIETRYKNKIKGDKAYPGRFWIKDKVISFWVYPNEKLFIDIIKRLEKRLKRKIFNNGWMIEVLKDDDIIQKKDFKDSGDEFFDNYWCDDNSIFIPIEDYSGSLDVPEEQKLWHLMNAEEKRIAKLKGEAPDFRGWGSDMTAWDGPRPLPYRQAIYQENKIIK